MSYIGNYRTAVVNCNSTGDNTLIAGTTGRVLKIIGYSITSTAGTQATFWGGPSGSGTQLTGAFQLVANGSMYEPDLS